MTAAIEDAPDASEAWATRMEMPTSLHPDELHKAVSAALRVWAEELFTRVDAALTRLNGEEWWELAGLTGRQSTRDEALLARALGKPSQLNVRGVITGTQMDLCRRVGRVRNSHAHRNELHTEDKAKFWLKTIAQCSREFGLTCTSDIVAASDEIARLRWEPQDSRTPAQLRQESLARVAAVEAAEVSRDEALRAQESLQRKLARAEASRHEAEAKVATSAAERDLLLASNDAERRAHAEELSRLRADMAEARHREADAQDRVALGEQHVDAANARVAETCQDVHQMRGEWSVPGDRPGHADTAATLDLLTGALVQSVSAQMPAVGDRWPFELGNDRWRLSPSSKTVVRLSDRRDLATLVGRRAAQRLTEQFLTVRPEGGRLWMDEDGDTVTHIDGHYVYLGRVAEDEPASATSPQMQLLIDAVHEAPASNARELAFRLRQSHWPLVTKRHLNPLLYASPAIFSNDGGVPPRWRLADNDRSRSRTGDHVPTSRYGVERTGRRSERANTYESLVSAVATAPLTRSVAIPRSERAAPGNILSLLNWQSEAVASWYQHGCHGIVEAVTGTGKTIVGLEAAAHAAREGQKTVVLVPSVDLQRQWVRRITEFLPQLTMATVGGHTAGDPSQADVTVAVVHSAVTRDLSNLSEDSLLIADEVHRYGASTWVYALRPGFQRRLGLTATLERSGDDAVDDVLRPYFGATVLNYGFERAIREDVVAPFRLVFAPVTLSDDEQMNYDKLSRQISDNLKKLSAAGALSKGNAGGLTAQLGRLRGAGGAVGRAAQFAESGMRQRRQMLARLENKLAAVEQLSEKVDSSHGTVIFTESKEMAEEAAARLRSWEVPAAALHGEMTEQERQDNLAALEDGRLQALAAPKLLDEGIDVPSVDFGLVMTASRSRRQMIQRLGRVIRKKPGGRAVDFVVLYGHDTVEDPEHGAHEGFFDLIGAIAASNVTLKPGWTALDL